MVLGKIYICENKKIKFQNALFTAARRFAGLWKVRKRHIVFYSRYAFSFLLFLPDKRCHTLSRYEHSRAVVKKCGGTCGDNTRNAENDK